MGEARPTLAFVIQRYGFDVTGGSESLARALAERLAPEYDITVFTTCARDYVTWKNELPPGSERVGEVEVLRFAVEEQRDLEAFNHYSESLYGSPHSHEDELEWLRRQGPYVPRLAEELRARQGGFSAILFFTYLYYPTYAGLQAVSRRSILVPTAHDEPPLRLGIYQELFRLPRAFGFLTPGEEALVRSRFPMGDRPALVAGMGVETPDTPDVEGFRTRYGVFGPYVLYAGRIDAGKGCAEMIEFYEGYRREKAAGVPLLLIGKLAMAEPGVAGVRYLGYLAEDDKAAALAGASVVLCPSPYESLSIALLEGFSLGIPALVNARCAVLRDHCLRSSGGLYYQDALEFVECLDLLLNDNVLRQALGEGGRRYVRENYSWAAVLDRYRALIHAVSGA